MTLYFCRAPGCSRTLETTRRLPICSGLGWSHDRMESARAKTQRLAKPDTPEAPPRRRGGSTTKAQAAPSQAVSGNFRPGDEGPSGPQGGEKA